MADTTNLVFYGLYDVVGVTLAAVICGLDCGDYVVAAGGTVTVPLQSDPDDLLTLAYMTAVSAAGPPAGGWGPLSTPVRVISGGVAVDLTIPCLFGYAYTSKGQLLRPLSEQDTKSRTGPALGKMRRVHKVAALVDASVGVSFGTDFTNLFAADYRDAAGTPLTKETMYSGVYWSPSIEDASSFDGMICWQVSRPYPTTIVSLGGFFHTQDG